jgi:glycosyltransferase involved in cell wall biosynthesis
MKKLLFVTHEFSRTGAPLVLLGFLRWLQREWPEYECHVLSLADGPLHAEFREVSTGVYISKIPNAVDRAIRRVKRRILGAGATDHLPQRLVERLGRTGWALIYANTVGSVPAACAIAANSSGKPHILAHIHEGETTLRGYVPDFARYLSAIDRIVAPSCLVRDELIACWKIAPDMLNVVYELSERVGPANSKSFPRETVTVGACGSVCWRKGYDLFLAVARYLARYAPDTPFRFVWVGKSDPQHLVAVEHDLRRAGLSQICRFVGEKEDPSEAFREFDILLLPSREDPFPLVAIEAGAQGIPIVCFEDATGTAEVLKNGGGAVVPYLDVRAMAEAVIELTADPSKYLFHAHRAAEAFSEFTADSQCPKLAAVLQDTLGRRGGPGG